MSCRDEILDCVKRVTSQKASDEFTIQEVLDCMRTRGTRYSDSTIRTHITSRLCVNAPSHHAARYPDLERIGDGTYRLKMPAEATGPAHAPAPAEPTRSNDPRSFQRLAARTLGEHFKTEFRQEEPILIGRPPKHHKFDLVSPDGRHVGECKSYSWTETGNVPSAKIATTNEAALFLSFLPPEVTRFLVLRRNESPTRQESLAAYYYRTYRHLLVGILLFELDEKSAALVQIGEVLTGSASDQA